MIAWALHTRPADRHSCLLKAVTRIAAGMIAWALHTRPEAADSPSAEIAAETALLTQCLWRAVRRNQHQPLAPYLPYLESTNTATSKIPLASKNARTASFRSSERRRKP
jgi:hypothetical protein